MLSSAVGFELQAFATFSPRRRFAGESQPSSDVDPTWTTSPRAEIVRLIANVQKAGSDVRIGRILPAQTTTVLEHVEWSSTPPGCARKKKNDGVRARNQND